MKIVHIVIWVILMLLSISACEDKEDDANNHSSLIGGWVNTADHSKHIEFVNDSMVVVHDHHFKYEQTSDSIYLVYNGPLFILCQKSALKYDLSGQILEIEGINKLCLVGGDSGISSYRKNISAKGFEGKWAAINADDTLNFVSEKRMNHSSGNYYDYYYSDDSITIKHAGPTEINLPAKTFAYKFKSDTLIINFRDGYFGTISDGTLKFLYYE